MDELKNMIVRTCIEATVEAWREFETWLGISSELAPLKRSNMQSMPENMMQVAIARKLYHKINEVVYVSLEEQVNKQLARSLPKEDQFLEERLMKRKIDVVGWDRNGKPLCLVEAKRGTKDDRLGSQLDDLRIICDQMGFNPLIFGVKCQRVHHPEKKRNSFSESHSSYVVEDFHAIEIEHKGLHKRGTHLAIIVCSPNNQKKA